uniref:Oxidoreductase-like domain-containing protein n=1 Tax=Nothoprocta perdicaria TaxID=30464 RepID=A0A8C6ZFA7_NOTPE
HGCPCEGPARRVLVPGSLFLGTLPARGTDTWHWGPGGLHAGTWHRDPAGLRVASARRRAQGSLRHSRGANPPLSVGLRRGNGAGTGPAPTLPEPPPPGSCCMSGCARCVWVVHAEELLRRHGPAALEQHVPDESVRAFLRLELRLRLKCACLMRSRVRGLCAAWPAGWLWREEARD